MNLALDRQNCCKFSRVEEDDDPSMGLGECVLSRPFAMKRRRVGAPSVVGCVGDVAERRVSPLCNGR